MQQYDSVHRKKTNITKIFIRCKLCDKKIKFGEKYYEEDGILRSGRFAGFGWERNLCKSCAKLMKD